MLEPYVTKVARTVLRRGGASNRVFLVYPHVAKSLNIITLFGEGRSMLNPAVVR